MSKELEHNNAIEIKQSQHKIKNDRLCKEPHTTIFTGPTGCGKSHLVLDLIEREYNKHFD